MKRVSIPMRNHQAVKICTVKVMEVENKEKVAEKNVNKQLLTTSQIWYKKLI